MEQKLEQQKLKDIIASREDGFGFLFKQARGEKNLTIDDIARQLRLDKKVILALESEDYTQLPASAFVCGYIRNYAKFLNIQPEPLIEYYKKERNEVSLEPKLKVNKEKEIQRRSGISALFMPLMLIFILSVLAAGGWQLWSYLAKNNVFNNSQQQDSTLSDMANDELNIDAENTLLLPEPDAAYELPAGEEVTEQSATTEAPDDAAAEGISLQESTDVQTGVSEAESSVAAQASLSAEGSLLAEGSIPADGSSLADNTSSSVNSLVNSNTSAEAVSTNIAEAAIVAAEGSLPADGSLPAEGSLLAEGSLPGEGSMSSEFKVNQLVVEFSGASWVSIKDADSKILSSGLIKSGKTLRLDGKLPYKVFLGDARMVTIRINGTIFDHSSYINAKNVARFEVE